MIKYFYSLLILITANAEAQILGGNSIYTFSKLPSSARVAALGGLNQSLRDKDVSLYFQNPAFLNEQMSNQLHVNNSFFIYGYAKNSRSNISEQEEVALKKLAKLYFSFSDEKIEQTLKSGELIEVK